MDLKTYNEIINLLNKKKETEKFIEGLTKHLNKEIEDTYKLYFNESEYIILNDYLINLLIKEFTKRLNAINGALKELETLDLEAYNYALHVQMFTL